jgi:hypothetical protein
VGSDDAEYARPDLPIPVCPAKGLSSLARLFFIDNEQGFRTARRLPVQAAVGAIALAVTRAALPPPWQRALADCAAVLGLYAAAGALAARVFERRQHAFEREWLAAQTGILRGHAFEALRCTVRGRSYDLARPGDVRDLRDQPRDERATVAFTYVTAGHQLAIAEVHRDVRELTFLPGWASPGQALVRFPEARYLPRPQPRQRPARRTSWSLDGSILISVSEDTAPAFGAGTRNSR